MGDLIGLANVRGGAVLIKDAFDFGGVDLDFFQDSGGLRETTSLFDQLLGPLQGKIDPYDHPFLKTVFLTELYINFFPTKIEACVFNLFADRLNHGR